MLSRLTLFGYQNIIITIRVLVKMGMSKDITLTRKS